MKTLLNDWNSFIQKEVKKHKRIVLNELAELTEEEIKQVPLSDEELEIIKRWGGLDGEVRFLGKGTMGSAFEVGNKVLKITSDQAEASAAAKIAGQEHPNVYKIDKVGQRQRKYTEMPQQRFVIIYDMVGDADAGFSFPPKEAQEVIQALHNTRESIKYNWPNNFSALLQKAVETVQENPDVFSIEIKGGNILPRLEKIVELSGMNRNEGQAFILAWTFVNGLYGCGKNADEFASCAQNEKFDYMDQVCNGLTFLNRNGIMFNDLKTTNVLREDDKLIIIDIGKSAVRGGTSIFEEIK